MIGRRDSERYGGDHRRDRAIVARGNDVVPASEEYFVPGARRIKIN